MYMQYICRASEGSPKPKNWTHVFNAYFQTKDDTAPGIKLAYFPLFKMQLTGKDAKHILTSALAIRLSIPDSLLLLCVCVAMKTCHTEWVVNPNFTQAVQALPPDYSSATNQMLYREFIRAFGTSVITNMTLGGAIEMQSQFKTALTDDGYTAQMLADRIENDFNIGLNQMCGDPVPVDPTYM